MSVLLLKGVRSRFQENNPGNCTAGGLKTGEGKDFTIIQMR